MEGESPTLIFKTCVLSNTLGQNLHSLPLIGFYYLFSCWITATQKLWIYNACLGQLKPTAVWNTKKRNYTISSYGKSYSKIYIKLMSICFFHWCLTSKKSKWDIKSVERYQRLKNTQLWLPEILSWMLNDLDLRSFSEKTNDLIFLKFQKLCFLGIFYLFWGISLSY